MRVACPTVTTRVRFAPSPTGFLHLGSARTALFNWLYARSTGGEFWLRVEDTDGERSKPELIQMIFDSLDWLQLDWDNRGDEMFQSQRTDAYRSAIDQLLSDGNAYWCDCSQEAVKARNEQAGGPPGYDGFCRDRGLDASTGLVVRFATPGSGVTAWDDMIRGHVSFENANLEDFVLQRSDGSPVFLIANTVDDAAMAITHVVRGEDLINVTPKVLLLRAALSLGAPPVFAHLPLIVNEQRKKLSKRRDDVALGDYQDRGVLPSAMVNYLALLGWGPPDGVEVHTVAELAAPGFFDLSAVSPSPAAFDVRKLEHVNGEHIRMLSVDEFVDVARPFLEREPWAKSIDWAVLSAIAPELQTRVKVLSEVGAMVDFFFSDGAPFDDAALAKGITANPAAGDILSGALDRFASCDWSSAALHAATAELGESLGLKLGKAQAPIRVAVTGKLVGPPLFESLELLGREVVLARLRAAEALLGDRAPESE